MFYSLRGKLVFSDTSCAVVECGGVGYKCTITYNTLQALPKMGDEITVFTYLAVRENDVELFGFASVDELDFFKMLISVNGVGPKAAIALLSEFSPDKLAIAIAGGDVKAITRANGVGSKMAQRIVLELKDKVAKGLGVEAASASSTASFVANSISNSSVSEAVAALVALGYSQSEAASAVSGIDATLSVDDIIKQALKRLF